MKISKKQLLILQEGILLDDLTNYSDLEKKILKSLHKRYKDAGTFDLYTNDLATELHEKWGFPLDLSYKMAKIYNYKRDVLFSESSHTIDIKHSEILHNNLSKILRQFSSTLINEQLGEITDTKGNKYEANLWVYSDSFNIYIIPENRIDDRILFRCEINFIDKAGSYLDKPILTIDYKINDVKYPVGEYEFELPEKMDNNSIMKWVKSMVEFVKDIFSRTAF